MQFEIFRNRMKVTQKLKKKPLQYRDVIVHCGVHKTGSSYIQSLLADHKDVLAARSIHYPEFINGEGHRHFGNHSVIGLTLVDNPDMRRHFSNFVRLESDCNTLLLSGEEFSRTLAEPELLNRFLLMFPGARVRFLFYLRRPDHLLEAVYAESVKNTLHGDITKAAYQLDFGRSIEPFAEAVGKKNIIIRPYNSNLWAEQELGADFCSSIGYPDLWREIEPTEELRVNVSLGRAETFLLSQLKTREGKEKLRAFLEKTKPQFPGPDAKFFRSPEARQAFNMSHLKALQNFADSYSLGDIVDFLDMRNYNDDPDWVEFKPHWAEVSKYFSSLIDDIAVEQRYKQLI